MRRTNVFLCPLFHFGLSDCSQIHIAIMNHNDPNSFSGYYDPELEHWERTPYNPYTGVNNHSQSTSRRPGPVAPNQNHLHYSSQTGQNPYDGHSYSYGPQPHQPGSHTWGTALQDGNPSPYGSYSHSAQTALPVRSLGAPDVTQPVYPPPPLPHTSPRSWEGHLLPPHPPHPGNPNWISTANWLGTEQRQTDTLQPSYPPSAYYGAPRPPPATQSQGMFTTSSRFLQLHHPIASYPRPLVSGVWGLTPVVLQEGAWDAHFPPSLEYLP